MLKGLFFGFLGGCILVGICWFGFGRANIADIRGATDRFNGDLQRVEQLVNEFGIDFDRHTGKISLSVGEAEQLRDQIGDLRNEFSEYPSEVGNTRSELESISNGVDAIEGNVRRSIQISRDFADILFFYRRLGEESRTEE